MTKLPLAPARRFTGDELAHVAWGFASHGFYKPRVFDALAKQFVLERWVGRALPPRARALCNQHALTTHKP